jgi:hypothetical protein
MQIPPTLADAEFPSALEAVFDVEAFIKAGVFADWLLLVVLVASPVNYEVKRLHKGAARQIGAMEGPQPALPTPGPNGGNAVKAAPAKMEPSQEAPPSVPPSPAGSG